MPHTHGFEAREERRTLHFIVRENVPPVLSPVNTLGLIHKYSPASLFSGVRRVKLFLKTTGRKLSHVNRQLRVGAAISTSRRLTR